MRSEEEIKNEIHWLLKNNVRDQYTPIINTLLWVLGEDLEGYLKEEKE